MRLTPFGSHVSSLRRACAGCVVVLLLATACGGSERTSDQFCDKLGEVTGPDGVESALVAGDPARIDGVIVELTELHDRAPEDISATTRTLVDFFESYQRAARDERRDVIADNEAALQSASARLDDYALTECGLILTRVAPTAVPTANPSIDAQAD